jgi:hypothetical protein
LFKIKSAPILARADFVNVEGRAARSFFDSHRSTVLNIRARLLIGFVKQDIVELPPINHFPAPAALVEMFFLGVA